MVDAVIVGGGLQGLLCLRALVAAGADAVLVTGGAVVGGAQTMHSHALLESGMGLITGETRHVVDEVVLPDLARLGVPVREVGADVLGSAAVAHVVDKAGLAAGLVRGMESRIVPALDDSRPPAATVVAAGCGTARVLQAMGVEAADAMSRVGYAKSHIVCLRGDALPPTGVVMRPDVMVVPYPWEDESLWYVTPADPSMPRADDAPDDAVAPVDEAMVAAALSAVDSLWPGVSGRVAVSAYVGWKQDVDGVATRRLCEVVGPSRPVVVALPGVLANAWVNAADVVAAVVKLVK